jgi:hypothetical protein
MAFDYDAIVSNVVIPQLQDKGVDAVLTREFGVDGEWEKKFDPVTFEQYWENSDGDISSTEPSGLVEVYAGKVLVTDFTDEERTDSSIKVGDKKLLTIELPAPIQGDVITIRGVDYSYINHSTVAPASTDVLYKIQVRI